VIITKAKNEAIEIIEGSNKLIENTIKEIRESQADKEKTKKLREKIISKEKNQKGRKPQKLQEEKTDSKLSKGDHVKIKDQNMVGEITDISDTFAMVSFDTFTIRSSIENLTKTSKPQTLKHSTKSKRSYFFIY